MATPAVQQPQSQTHGTVRVSLPASVAYHPETLKKTIAGVLERLGCPRCFSGADCLFSLEREYSVDPRGAIEARALGPHPEPWKSSTVTASLARGVRYDIEKVFQAIDKVIAGIGSCPCHSGFDVLYLNEIKVIGVNERLEAQQYGG
jgi:hypothetical protein